MIHFFLVGWRGGGVVFLESLRNNHAGIKYLFFHPLGSMIVRE